MGLRLRRRASSNRRRRRILVSRAGRRLASVAMIVCSAAQMAHDISASCCSSVGLVTGGKSLEAFQGSRGGRDERRYGVFVIRLGSLSGALPGRQSEPRRFLCCRLRVASRAVTRDLLIN